MKLTLLGLLVFLSATTRAQAQQCTLTTAQSPEIRAVRLGMSAEKLVAVFPEELNRSAIDGAIKESKKPENYGLGRAELRPVPGVTNPKFVGVNWISIDLLDERVTAFTIQYGGPAWASVDQFVTKLSESLKLPAADQWTGDATNQNKSLRCEGFGVTAFAINGINGGIVSVRDALASQTMANRRESEKEKERRAFKP